MSQNRVRAWAELGRISNLPSVFFNLLTGLILRDITNIAPILLTLLGGTSFYLAGMILNDAADAAWDRTHAPSRPIPSGRVPISDAWTAGVLCLALGSAAFHLGGIPWYWIAALALAILAYDLHHKNWAPSVWVMGLCRALLAPLAAASSPSNEGVWWLQPWLWGCLLGLYIVGLSLCARSAGRGRISLYAVVYLTAPLLISGYACLQNLTFPTLFTWLSAVVLILTCLRLLRDPSRTGDAVGWLLAGMILIDAQAWACSSHPLWWIPIPSVLLLRSFQRWISAH